MKPYKTLMKRAEDEFIVNKSRFIGHGCPCETEDDALKFLAEMRAKYKDASHNCYAYIIGVNMGVMRYSDDGEPGGTAGMPIIEVLKARGVTNCCAVVTRYFGGILLGAGGLVRAYTKGAAIALDACGVGVMHPTVRCLVDIKYSLLSRLEYYLASAPVIIEDKAFTDAVTITLLIKCADEQDVIKHISDVTEGAAEIARFDEFFKAWNEGE